MLILTGQKQQQQQKLRMLAPVWFCPVKIRVLFNLFCVWILFRNASSQLGFRFLFLFQSNVTFRQFSALIDAKAPVMHAITVLGWGGVLTLTLESTNHLPPMTI